MKFNGVGFNSKWASSISEDAFVAHESHHDLTEAQLRQAHRLIMEKENPTIDRDTEKSFIDRKGIQAETDSLISTLEEVGTKVNKQSEKVIGNGNDKRFQEKSGSVRAKSGRAGGSVSGGHKSKDSKSE